MKQWSLKSVTDSLKYNEVSYSNCHDIFIKWVSDKFDQKIDVIDIGGGNGRVLINLSKYINKYYCLDLNPDNIQIGREYFNNEDYIFQIFDIDNEEIPFKSDVCYIDSVLTMIEDPFKALLKFKNCSEYTFVNRTLFSNETLKGSYKWSGMNEPSTLWSFNFYEMDSFCNENGMILSKHSQNSFIIKNNN